MNNLDAYYKKTVVYKYRGRNLLFEVSQALFSSHDIDVGTRRLLQTLTSEGFNIYNKVLDLGCGYGPIGISLKSLYEPSIIHMVDRDALALAFSRQNAELNGLKEIKIYGSLGYDDVSERDFDLIVSNIPAKVGEPVLSYILEGARFYIRPEGRIAIVVIDAIGDYVAEVLKSNRDINIIFRRRWPGHLVFHYKFSSNAFKEPQPKTSAFDSGIYNRGRKDIAIEGARISVETAYGLPEFDTLSYETELLLNKLKTFKDREINRVIVFNPEQGIIPTVLVKVSKVKEMVLVDRDLEALRVSQRNLISNGFNADKTFLFHKVGLPRNDRGLGDFVIGVLDEKDGPRVHLKFVKEAAERLAVGGLLLLTSGSTPIVRIGSFVKREKLFEIVERQKSKRKSLIVLKRKN